MMNHHCSFLGLQVSLLQGSSDRAVKDLPEIHLALPCGFELLGER